MPGYIMHLVEAEQVLRKLERQTGIQAEESWRSRYLLGALLPDTKTGAEKQQSHFWTEETLQKLARAPHLPLFLEKYQTSLSDPVVFGYLVHLHLDSCYVNGYWPSVFSLQNDAGEPEEGYEQVTRIWLKKQKQLVDRQVFFTKDWYYGDYSALNHYLIQKYHIELPVYPLAAPLGMSIEEADERELGTLLQRLQHYLQEADVQQLTDGGREGQMSQTQMPSLKVLDLPALERFLEETANALVQEYGNQWLGKRKRER